MRLPTQPASRIDELLPHRFDLIGRLPDLVTKEP